MLRDVPFWSGRPWLRRLALFAYFYLGILLLLLWLENRFLYPGWSMPSGWDPPSKAQGATDFHVTAADGTAIGARWNEPVGWKPADGAILHSHGNGGNLSHRAWQVDLWRQRGFKQAMLLYDYPGFGKSAGTPTEAGCHAAGDACHAWLVDEKKVPPDKLILLGESLGGAIAVDMAGRLPHRALVTMGAFTSFPDMAQMKYPWLPARWLVRNQFLSVAKVPRLKLFIAHGTADTLIPPSHAERLHAAAGEGSRLLLIDGLGHAPPDSPEFFDAVREWLGE